MEVGLLRGNDETHLVSTLGAGLVCSCLELQLLQLPNAEDEKSHGGQNYWNMYSVPPGCFWCFH